MNEFRHFSDGAFVYRFLSQTAITEKAHKAGSQRKDPLRKVSKNKASKSKKFPSKQYQQLRNVIQDLHKDLEQQKEKIQNVSGSKANDVSAHLKLAIFQKDPAKLQLFQAQEFTQLDNNRLTALFYAVSEKWWSGVDHIVHHAPESLNIRNGENKTGSMFALHRKTADFTKLAIHMINNSHTDCTLADSCGNSYPILLADTLQFEPQTRVQSNYLTGEALISALTRGAVLSATNSYGANLFHVLATKMAVEIGERIIELTTEDQRSTVINLMQARLENKTPVRIALDGKGSDYRTAKFLFAFLKKGMGVNVVEGQLDIFSRAILNKKFRTAEVCSKFYISARPEVLFKAILTILNVNAKIVQLLAASSLPAKIKLLHEKIKCMITTLFGYAALESNLTNVSNLLTTDTIESCYKLEQEVRKHLGVTNAKIIAASLSIADILTVPVPPSSREDFG